MLPVTVVRMGNASAPEKSVLSVQQNHNPMRTNAGRQVSSMMPDEHIRFTMFS